MTSGVSVGYTHPPGPKKQHGPWIPTWIQIAAQITDIYMTLVLVTWAKDINMIYNYNNVLDQNVPSAAA